ncbi:MAG: DNA repair protein RadA [Candidatus Levybacteria bacterium]|nr:DNA repair protein RadA [Candidatus Levybacteria bacterium]
MKSSISFVCQECGYESVQWLGKCPECGNWNSLKEISNIIGSAGSGKIKRERERVIVDLRPKPLSEVHYEEKNRIKTGFSEVDGVLGGGIVPGSVILLAGDPGIGKSTLLLQIALKIAQGPVAGFPPASAPLVSPPAGGTERVRAVGSPSTRTTLRNNHILYISGEESEEQIKLRANRLNSQKNENFLLLSINNTDAVVSVIENMVIKNIKPSLVIIDSIQTMESENLEGLSGTLGQVRYSASLFIKLAKTLGIPIILVGHVTKEGMVAGPMILSHMVDVVLFLEGEKTTQTRILRGLKNRFGPIDEIGVFVMEGEGMNEVRNAEQFFLTQRQNKASGSVLVVTLEGTRAFLVELQALTVFSKLPYPRRIATGVDSRRLELLLAVLQKHCRLPLETMDVFVNAAGGLRISDTASDLGICLAIFSSLKNMPLANTVAISEVGLLGELRSVGLLDKRIKEAKKLGFKNIISSRTHRYLNEAIGELTKQ